MTDAYMKVMLEIIDFKDNCSYPELETMLIAEKVIAKAKVSSAIGLVLDDDAE